MSKKIKTLLKLIFSLIIIFYLFSRAPLKQVLLALRNVQGRFIASAIFFSSPGGGISNSTALAFSLLCLVVVWSVSLLGGVVYLLGNFEANVKDHISAQPREEVEAKPSFN